VLLAVPTEQLAEKLHALHLATGMSAKHASSLVTYAMFLPPLPEEEDIDDSEDFVGTNGFGAVQGEKSGRHTIA
jgi:hypothetical protein